MPIAYLVTRSTIGPEDEAFSEAFGAFIEAIEAAGLAFEIPESTESPVQIVQTWPILGRKGKVVVYDNFDTGVRHLELVGADDAVLGLLKREASAHLPIEAHEDLLAACLESMKAKALVKLTLSAPEPIGDEAAALITATLEHDDPTLRRHAAYCMGLLAEPRFERALRARVQIETEAAVADFIRQALQFY